MSTVIVILAMLPLLWGGYWLVHRMQLFFSHQRKHHENKRPVSHEPWQDPPCGLEKNRHL